MDVKAIIKMALAGDTKGAAAALKGLLGKAKDTLKEDAKEFRTASVLEAEMCDDDNDDPTSGKTYPKPNVPGDKEPDAAPK